MTGQLANLTCHLPGFEHEVVIAFGVRGEPLPIGEADPVIAIGSRARRRGAEWRGGADDLAAEQFHGLASLALRNDTASRTA
jgi:hypothetical protein